VRNIITGLSALILISGLGTAACAAEEPAKTDDKSSTETPAAGGTPPAAEGEKPAAGGETAAYRCVGQEINANHVRAVASGFVIGTARPHHIGRRSHVWEIRITDERDKLVCISRITMSVLERQPGDLPTGFV
jgi:acyl-coenzyme A thioesterase PaaI-like protein